jgi:uncharacterized membrane protein
MATLSAWEFDTAEGAPASEQTLIAVSNGVHAGLIHTNLSNEDEAELSAAFADED